MKDVESWLRAVSRPEPSPDFDRRMAQLFAAAPVRRGGWLSRPVPFWLAAGALLVVGLSAYLGGRSTAVASPEAPPPPVFVILQDGGTGLGANYMTPERPLGVLTTPDAFRLEIDGVPQVSHKGSI